jgi:hypothetical protein
VQTMHELVARYFFKAIDISKSFYGVANTRCTTKDHEDTWLVRCDGRSRSVSTATRRLASAAETLCQSCARTSFPFRSLSVNNYSGICGSSY